MGPFSAPIRPFTVNGAQTLCYVNVNELLGFEIGDLTTGQKLHRVEVQGYQQGPVKRHGCPSHGIGLTPDERELWLCDGANSAMHVFDNTVMPPKQTVTLAVRDQPGWVTFSIDGRYAYPSTGEVFDTRTKKMIVGTGGRGRPADRQREAARGRLRRRRSQSGTATSSAWGRSASPGAALTGPRGGHIVHAATDPGPQVPTLSMRKIDLTNFQLATSETARQINRRIALNFIRRNEPMSRADLARCSGLQRSTVSAIIDQLIDEGWVTEGAIGQALRGRRPRFLHLNVGRAGILAVDLRPAITTVGLAGVDARFVEQTSWPTPKDPEVFIRQLARTVTLFRSSHPRMVCEGMGVSVPGRADRSGRLVFAPNLGWGQVELKRMIEAEIGLPVALENAANACALAELWFGLHPEHLRHLVAVTVSEGIGVGLLLNGQLVHGGDAMAGEFAHVSVDEERAAVPVRGPRLLGTVRV